MKAVCLLGVMLLLVSSAGPAQPQTKRSIFAAAPEFTKPITVEEPLARLDHVVKEVARRCGGSLAVDREIAGETVIAIARDQPAHRLLEELAQALGYTWTSVRSEGGKPSFRLVEGADARSRAQHLRRASRAAAARDLQAFIDGTLQYVQKFRDLQPRDALDKLQQLEKEVQALPIGPEQYQRELDLQAARFSREPSTVAMLLAYKVLPPPLQQQVLDGERVLMATRRAGAAPMPAEVLAALRAAREFEAVRSSPGPQRPEIRQTDDEAVDLTTFRQGGRLRLRGRARRLWDHRSAPFTLVPRLQFSPSQATHAPFADDAPGQVTADRPEDLRQGVDVQLPQIKLVPEDPLTYTRALVLPRLLRDLAKHNPSLRFVGDAYYLPLRPLRRGGAPEARGSDPAGAAYFYLRLQAPDAPVPLEPVLRELAARGNTNIHLTRDGWVRCRSTLYPDLRDGAVDAETLRKAFQPVIEARAYSPDAAMAAARLLSRAQADGLNDMELGFLTGIIRHPELVWGLFGWQLIGGLTSENRKHLLSGVPLRCSRLSRAEQGELRSLITGISASPDGPPLDLELGPADYPRLSLVLPEPDNKVRRTLELRLDGFAHPVAKQSLWANWEKMQEAADARHSGLRGG